MKMNFQWLSCFLLMMLLPASADDCSFSQTLYESQSNVRGYVTLTLTATTAKFTYVITNPLAGSPIDKVFGWIGDSDKSVPGSFGSWQLQAPVPAGSELYFEVEKPLSQFTDFSGTLPSCTATGLALNWGAHVSFSGKTAIICYTQPSTGKNGNGLWAYCTVPAVCKTVCNDNDACTTDTCDAVTGCVYKPKNCDDSDKCTKDSCSNGACINAPIIADCDDSDKCTEDSCKANKCVNDPILADCGDSNKCTTDSCVKNKCYNTPTIADCDDSNKCTKDSCKDNKCVNDPILADCDDSDKCTKDSCKDNKCVNDPILADCDDSDKCTSDSCVKNKCVNTAFTAACDDGNVCTVDACSSNTCTNSVTPAATCTKAAEGVWDTAQSCSATSYTNELQYRVTTCNTALGPVGSIAELQSVCPRPPDATANPCPAPGTGSQVQQVFKLWLGNNQQNLIGSVTAVWSDNNLVVTYELTSPDGYVLNQIHITVTKTVPTSTNFGNYPYIKAFGGNVKKATVTISKQSALTDLFSKCPANGLYYMVAHASVANAGNCNGGTACAAADFGGGKINTNNWFTYVPIYNCKCSGAPKSALDDSEVSATTATANNNVVAMGVMGAVIAVLALVAAAGWMVAYHRRPSAETFFAVNAVADPYASGPVASGAMSPGAQSPGIVSPSLRQGNPLPDRKELPTPVASNVVGAH